MKLPYFLLDVFTRDRLAGNPLAVVLKADGLSGARMQAIAAEFNLSETVFVLPPQNERHTNALRIFTTTSELPFAGHPTVGAAVLLGLQSRATAVRLELGVGLVTAIMERIDRRTGEAKFALPRLPEKLDDAPDNAVIAHQLGLSPDDIGFDGWNPAQFSAGLRFFLVPVRDAEALSRLTMRREGWDDTFPGDHNAVYAFTPTPDERGNDYAARMLSPGLGTGEDPATGSAAAALIGFLAGLPEFVDGHHVVRLRQGKEMGRPSLVELQFNTENGELRHAGIGGSAVVLAEGVLDLDE